MTATSCSEAGDTTAPGMGELYALHRVYSSQSGSVGAVIKAELDSFGLSSLFSEKRAASDAACPEEAMGVSSRRGVYFKDISDTEICLLHLQPPGEHGCYIFPRRITDDPSGEAIQSLFSCQPLAGASATLNL